MAAVHLMFLTILPSIIICLKSGTGQNQCERLQSINSCADIQSQHHSVQHAINT